MRLPVDHFRRHALRIGLIAFGSVALSGCAVIGGGDLAAIGSAPGGTANQSANIGPAADYPVVVGAPYQIGEKVFTPVDTLNYDEVGYAVADSTAGISGAHHTLPLPSYVEVTSLDSGKTILVRIEKRGPMGSDALVGLSPAAFAQLGLAPGASVRVRRVNPPEEERAMLRGGQSAPPRMETPESLLAVLKRKLPASGSVQLARSEPPKPIADVPVAPSSANRPEEAAYAPPARASATQKRAISAPALPPLGQAQAPQGSSASVYSPPASIAVAKPLPAPPKSAGDGVFVVQVAALSSLDSAQRVANVTGGRVTQTGSLYRIRTGPFATRGQAEASLAKVRAAGYSDARIFTNG